MQQSLTNNATQSRTKPSTQCISIVLSIPSQPQAQSILPLSTLHGLEYFSPSAIVPYFLHIYKLKAGINEAEEYVLGDTS